ncbi:MAG: Omp28-related outer membrane protein [Bacteroidetes bacterium]|nr:Omp28-related outer membrane protein [Bacteroidota bacterium]
METKLTIGSAVKTFLLMTAFLIIFNSGKTYAEALSLNQDFDNTSFPPAGWTLAHTAAYDWIRTSYASGYGQGTSCAMFDFYDYASGSFDLITPTLPLAITGDSLKFDHAYAPATSENDQLQISTSTDNGATWTVLITLNGGSSGPLRTGAPTQHLYVPTASEWATKTYALPAGTNKVKFTAISAFGNNLYLDNIRMGTRYTADVGVNSVFDPKWGMTPQSKGVKATVKNFGTTAQSFNVTLSINPGGFTNTQSVTNLAPGTSQTVTFSNYTFAAAGNYTIKAYTTAAGDLNRSNDTISNNLVVTTNLRNAVLEFCTGTWCQWCPCGDNEAHNLKEAYPNTVMFAYHGASTDPWKTFNGNGIISALGFSGYPSGLVDRRLGVNNGWGSMFTDGEYRYAQKPASDVAIAVTNTTYNAGTRQLTVNLNATALANLTGQYKVNYIITEDNMVYAQTGNSYCTGSSTWVHNWTVRNIVNTMAGDNVNSGAWSNGQAIPLTFNVTLDPAWVAANCKFNVVIFKDSGVLNTSEMEQGISAPVVTTAIGNQGSEVPEKYELSQNFPNPFNPTTNINFAIPKDGFASLKVYNTLGQLVGTYLDGYVKAGFYNAQIDGASLASGVYFYTLKTSNFVETKKMNLVK